MPISILGINVMGNDFNEYINIGSDDRLMIVVGMAKKMITDIFIDSHSERIMIMGSVDFNMLATIMMVILITIIMRAVANIGMIVFE